MKSMIIKNNVGGGTASIFLDIALKKAKIIIQQDAMNSIIDNIFNDFNDGDDEIVNNANAFLNFLDILQTHVQLDNKNHDTCTKMMRKMNILIPSTAGKFFDMYKINALTQYLDLSMKALGKYKNHNSDANVIKTLINSTVNTFILTYPANTDENTKNIVLNKLKTCISSCELSKMDVELMLLKLKPHMSQNLMHIINSAVSQQDQTHDKTFDFVFNKKIINPVFIKLHNNEIVIDYTTLGTNELEQLINGVTTIAEIVNYNHTTPIIAKKLEFMSMLNTHQSSAN